MRRLVGLGVRAAGHQQQRRSALATGHLILFQEEGVVVALLGLGWRDVGAVIKVGQVRDGSQTGKFFFFAALASQLHGIKAAF